MQVVSTFFRRQLPLALALTFAPTVAFAQAEDDVAELDESLDEDEDLDEDVEEDEEGSEDAESSEAADTETEGEADQEPAPAENVQTVYAIQAKQNLVSGSFELAPQFVTSVNDRYRRHVGGILSAIYHVRENFAVELSAGGLYGSATDLTIELRNKASLTPPEARLYQMNALIGADVQWSPVYGKVAIQDMVLGQFNLYFSVGVGAAMMGLEEFNGSGEQLQLENGGWAPMTTFGGGMRFYFTDWLGVRLEVRDYVQALYTTKAISQAPSSAISNTLLTQLGVSFLF